MAKMADAADAKPKRRKKKYSPEFRAGAVALVLNEGKAIAEVARNLDITPSALSIWVRQVRADGDGGKSGLTTDERAELSSLRKQVRELKLERELLKKWAAFFAKENA